MLSLPPMEGSAHAPAGPSRRPAARRRACPSASGTSWSRSKYSWKVSRAFKRVRAHGSQLGEALHHGVGGALEGGVPRTRRGCSRSSWRWRRRSRPSPRGAWPPWPPRGSAGTCRQKGISTVAAPMLASNRSDKPLLAADLQPGQVLFQGLCGPLFRPGRRARSCGSSRPRARRFPPRRSG